MDKYLLLIILNVPFVAFGLIRAITMYKNGIASRFGFAVRMVFWLVVLAGLVFARGLYNFLNSNQLTDTAPLSLADVALVTGVNFCLFLCIRAYARIETTEHKLNELQEKLSIHFSRSKEKE